MTLLAFRDRVEESALNVGAGTVTLLGARSGRKTFATAGLNGLTVPYCIQHRTSGQWEVGYGIYTSSGTTLTRLIVLSNSSGTTSTITFSAGAVDVWNDLPASKVLALDADSSRLTLPGALTVATTLDVTGVATLSALNLRTTALTGRSLDIGDGGSTPGTSGILNISGTFAGTARDVISITAALNGASSPLAIYANPTFNISGAGQDVGGANFGVTIATGGTNVTQSFGLQTGYMLVTGGGTLANAIGLNVLDVTAATANWAIKTGLGLVALGDGVTVAGHTAMGDGAEIDDGGVNPSVLLIEETMTEALMTGLYVEITANPAANGWEFLPFSNVNSIKATNTKTSDKPNIANYNELIHRGSGNITGSGYLNALTGYVDSEGSADVSYISGLDLSVFASGSGHVAALIGIGLDMSAAGTGVVDVATGILIGDITRGTTNFAIRTGLGLVSFGSTLTVASSITSTSGGLFLPAAGITLDGSGLSSPTANNDAAGISINYIGYNGGTTRFRDFYVFDGKSAPLLFLDGSAKTLTLSCNTVMYAVLAAGTATLNLTAASGADRTLLFCGVAGVSAGLGVAYTSGQMRYTLADLPTSASGLPAGALWNSSGVVHVA